MTDFTQSFDAPRRNYSQLALRWLLFAMLGLFALFYLMPLFGSIMAILFIGEQLATFHAIGYILIVAGVACAQGTVKSKKTA